MTGNALRHRDDGLLGTKAYRRPLLAESVVMRSAMPKQKNLRELFHDTLKDIYFVSTKYSPNWTRRRVARLAMPY
jgi:hypothetical protein